jgi:phosphate starvation-inducible PhoH-like protein
VAHAIALFERKEVDRILSRPAVEAGERLASCPATCAKRSIPICARSTTRWPTRWTPASSSAPADQRDRDRALAFMRGRTLSNAIIILDEAQNTTSMQMKMFLTRLGENSRMIIGDPSQVDLPPGQTSGLFEAVRLLADVEGTPGRLHPQRRDPP